MRLPIAVAAVLSLAAPAEAKYDACRSPGGFLVPPGPLPRNVKLWRAQDEDVYRAEVHVRGPGIDRVAHAVPGQSYLDVGVLPPHATYEVVVPRWNNLVFGRFTTSDDVDDQAPRAPRFRALAIAHPSDSRHAAADDVPVNVDDGSLHDSGYDRSPANDFSIDLDLSEDTAFLDVTLEGEGTATQEILWREDLASLGRTWCGYWHHLAAGTRACLTVRAIDLAGNVGDPVTRCTTVVDQPGNSQRELEPLRRFPDPARTAPPRGLPGWTAPGLFVVLVLAFGLAFRVVTARAVPTRAC